MQREFRLYIIVFVKEDSVEESILPILDNKPNYHSVFSLKNFHWVISAFMILPAIWGVYKFGFKAFLIISTSVVFSFLLCFISVVARNKQSNIKYYLGRSLMNALLIALSFGANTPIYIPIIAIFLAFFLEFTLNFENGAVYPTIFGLVFVFVFFQKYYLVDSPDALSGASVLTEYKKSGFNLSFLDSYFESVPSFDKSIAATLNNSMLSKFGLDISFAHVALFLGNIKSGIGDSSSIIILICLLLLFSSSAIRLSSASLSFFIFFALFSYVFGDMFSNGFYVENLFKGAPFLNVLMGGFLFSLTFLVPNVFTLPLSRFSMILYGFFLALFLFMFRYLSKYPDGTVFAIAISMALIFIFDGFFVRSSR